MRGRLQGQLWHSFLVCCSDPRHRFIFRRPQNTLAGNAFSWHLGLGRFRDSCAIALLVVAAEVPGHQGRQQVVIGGSVAPALPPILDWGDLVAEVVEWRAWSWQAGMMPNTKAYWRPVVRMFVDGPEMPLLKLVGR